MTRKIMWATSFPHLKKINEPDLLPFPWDQTIMEEMSQEESKNFKEGAEKVKEFYRIQDEKKKSKNL